uniref:Ion transport domain-containing protein n=1 Tax=Chromera velia CCMP2878 TaxID=1169474 RepID=A0A0G4HUY6_9ALVE|eukprot:Cvel_1391.t1-p1 / transcript=Cvel_1391.t1 / gene=Cvel_1391 / organism=Chromera_velia_CCMP2878 / gene_product=hypothetical protein / transcript_product=hypothetical protein / location=Cvel_scaffold48:91289-101650(-) / protein_length=1598 / sequence_SO=supercontig / SO=protein_coding / is_pseudo=false
MPDKNVKPAPDFFSGCEGLGERVVTSSSGAKVCIVSAKGHVRVLELQKALSVTNNSTLLFSSEDAEAGKAINLPSLQQTHKVETILDPGKFFACFAAAWIDEERVLVAGLQQKNAPGNDTGKARPWVIMFDLSNKSQAEPWFGDPRQHAIRAVAAQQVGSRVFVAAGFSNGLVQLFSLEGGSGGRSKFKEEPMPCEWKHTDRVNGLSFQICESPEGTAGDEESSLTSDLKLASISNDGHVRMMTLFHFTSGGGLYNAKKPDQGEPPVIFSGHSHFAPSVCFDSTHMRVLHISEGGGLVVQCSQTGEILLHLKLGWVEGEKGDASSGGEGIAVLPAERVDERMREKARDEGGLALWDACFVNDCKQVAVFTKREVLFLLDAFNGRTVAVREPPEAGMGETTPRLAWSAATGLVCYLRPYATKKDLRLSAIASGENDSVSWEMAEEMTPRACEATHDGVKFISYAFSSSPSGHLCALVSRDEQLEVRSMATGRPLTFPHPPTGVMCTALSTSGKTLAVVTKGDLSLWRLGCVRGPEKQSTVTLSSLGLTRAHEVEFFPDRRGGKVCVALRGTDKGQTACVVVAREEPGGRVVFVAGSGDLAQGQADLKASSLSGLRCWTEPEGGGTSMPMMGVSTFVPKDSDGNVLVLRMKEPSEVPNTQEKAPLTKQDTMKLDRRFSEDRPFSAAKIKVNRVVYSLTVSNPPEGKGAISGHPFLVAAAADGGNIYLIGSDTDGKRLVGLNQLGGVAEKDDKPLPVAKLRYWVEDLEFTPGGECLVALQVEAKKSACVQVMTLGETEGFQKSLLLHDQTWKIALAPGANDRPFPCACLSITPTQLRMTALSTPTPEAPPINQSPPTTAFPLQAPPSSLPSDEFNESRVRLAVHQPYSLVQALCDPAFRKALRKETMDICDDAAWHKYKSVCKYVHCKGLAWQDNWDRDGNEEQQFVSRIPTGATLLFLLLQDRLEYIRKNKKERPLPPEEGALKAKGWATGGRESSDAIFRVIQENPHALLELVEGVEREQGGLIDEEAGEEGMGATTPLLMLLEAVASAKDHAEARTREGLELILDCSLKALCSVRDSETTSRDRGDKVLEVLMDVQDTQRKFLVLDAKPSMWEFKGKWNYADLFHTRKPEESFFCAQRCVTLLTEIFPLGETREIVESVLLLLDRCVGSVNSGRYLPLLDSRGQKHSLSNKSFWAGMFGGGGKVGGSFACTGQWPDELTATAISPFRCTGRVVTGLGADEKKSDAWREEKQLPMSENDTLNRLGLCYWPVLESILQFCGDRNEEMMKHPFVRLVTRYKWSAILCTHTDATGWAVWKGTLWLTLVLVMLLKSWNFCANAFSVLKQSKLKDLRFGFISFREALNRADSFTFCRFLMISIAWPVLLLDAWMSFEEYSSGGFAAMRNHDRERVFLRLQGALLLLSLIGLFDRYRAFFVTGPYVHALLQIFNDMRGFAVLLLTVEVSFALLFSVAMTSEGEAFSISNALSRAYTFGMLGNVAEELNDEDTTYYVVVLLVILHLVVNLTMLSSLVAVMSKSWDKSINASETLGVRGRLKILLHGVDAAFFPWKRIQNKKVSPVCIFYEGSVEEMINNETRQFSL